MFGKSLVEKLSKALKPDLDDTVMLEILDILTDLLTRFAGTCTLPSPSLPSLRELRGAVLLFDGGNKNPGGETSWPPLIF